MARIAIEFTPAVAQGGGVARSVHEMTAGLLSEQAYEYTLFVAGNDPIPADIERLKPNVRRAPMSGLTLTRMWQRLRIPLPVELFTGGQDLFFATDFALPPLLPRTHAAVFIHDLTYIRVPDAAVPSLVAYLSAVVPRAVKRADMVIVNSAATKADIAEVYRVPEDRITAVQFGVSPRFAPSDTPREALRAKYGLPDRPYILAVGTVQPRKNYVRLVEALARLRAEHLDVGLVIAGGKGWLDTPIYEAVQSEHVESSVTFAGFVADDDLPALYTHAAAFAMPSLYEGFGLPVLEAMACGTAVITSNVSSLPEAAGNAAITLNPTDVEALTDALRQVLTDTALRDDMILRGKTHAAAFTWQRTATQLVSAFEKAISG